MARGSQGRSPHRASRAGQAVDTSSRAEARQETEQHQPADTDRAEHERTAARQPPHEAGGRVMRSPRTNRATFAEMETQLTEMIVELSTLGDDVSVDLADRLLHCQMERRARARAFAETSQPLMGWPYRCKSVACWACRRAVMAKWRERAEGLFADAESEDCSYITILLARIGDLSSLPEVSKKLRRDLRNLRDGMARKSASWNSLSLMGHIELDALEETDVPLLGSSRRAMVPLLPAVGGRPDTMFWVPHAHLCAHHPDVCREYLKHALAEQWSGINRVHIGAFDLDRFAKDNAPDCISYGLKFRNSTQFADGMVIDWPLAWSARVWSWLHEQRNGLQPLSVKLGCRSSPIDRVLSSTVRPVLEPMPIVL
jgi:hypothetical protein